MTPRNLVPMTAYNLGLIFRGHLATNRTAWNIVGGLDIKPTVKVGGKPKRRRAYVTREQAARVIAVFRAIHPRRKP